MPSAPCIAAGRARGEAGSRPAPARDPPPAGRFAQPSISRWVCSGHRVTRRQRRTGRGPHGSGGHEADAGSQAARGPPPATGRRCEHPTAWGRERGGHCVTRRPRRAECCPRGSLSEVLKAEHDTGSRAARCPPPTRVTWRCARPAASGRERGSRVLTRLPRRTERCPYGSCGHEADTPTRAAELCANRRMPSAVRSPQHRGMRGAVTA